MPRHALQLLLFLSIACALEARSAAPMPSIAQAREFRLKMLADYGVGTWDDLVLVRQCRRCGAVTGRQTVMPGVNRPLTVADWYARIGETAARTVLHRGCRSCGATPAGPGFRTILFSGLAFLEAGGDLEMTVESQAGRPPSVKLALAKTDGGVKELPWPLPPAKFDEIVGLPFSVRRAWADFLAANRASTKAGFRRVQDGYYMLVAPAVTPETAADVAKKAVVDVLDQLGTKAGALFVESFADLEDQKRPITKDTYHEWLREFAPGIEDGTVNTLAAVHPPAFMKVLAREAERLGVTATLPAAKGSDVQLAKGDIKITIPISGQLIRMIHQGLSFEQGVAPLLEEVNRVRGMYRLAKRLGELLAGRFKTEILDGRRLRFVLARGKPAPGTPELDLAQLAGKIDLSADGKNGSDRLARLIGLDVESGQFMKVAPAANECSCGRPASASLKVRPEGFAGEGRLTLAAGPGVVVAAAVECPDHIQYVKAGAPFRDMAAARLAFAAAAPTMVFPVTGVGLIPHNGVSLPYALGQDLPTVALDAGLAAGLLATLDAHFGDRASAPPRAKIPAAGGVAHLFAPFHHAVVFSPAPLEVADREHIARLLKDALESPFGRVDPGPALGLVRELKLDANPRGRFERR